MVTSPLSQLSVPDSHSLHLCCQPFPWQQSRERWFLFGQAAGEKVQWEEAAAGSKAIAAAGTSRPFARVRQSLEMAGETWSATTVQEYMEIAATTAPGCSGQTQDCFLVCCTSAFPASSQHNGMQGSDANFSMRTSNRPAFVYGISSLLEATLRLYSSHFNARCASQLPVPQPQFLPPLFPPLILPAQSLHHHSSSLWPSTGHSG